jgi:hypothetical protein
MAARVRRGAQEPLNRVEVIIEFMKCSRMRDASPRLIAPRHQSRLPRSDERGIKLGNLCSHDSLADLYTVKMMV